VPTPDADSAHRLIDLDSQGYSAISRPVVVILLPRVICLCPALVWQQQRLEYLDGSNASRRAIAVLAEIAVL
jgi:hypothetical protein